MKAAKFAARSFIRDDMPMLSYDDNLQDCVSYYLEHNLPEDEDAAYYSKVFKSCMLDKIKHEKYRTHETLYLETFTGKKNEAVISLINKLPDKQKSVIEMTFWGRMTTAEIATELTVSVRTIKRIRKKAYQNLKNLLTTL